VKTLSIVFLTIIDLLFRGSTSGYGKDALPWSDRGSCLFWGKCWFLICKWVVLVELSQCY